MLDRSKRKEKRSVKKKTVSAIMLTLLLVGMSTLASNIQPLNASLQTVKNQDQRGKSEQTRIIGHKISASELEELMSKLGVWEAGRNYNPIIDGRGTGLSPPTEEEWVAIADEAYVVEKILRSQPPPSSVDHTVDPWFPPIGDQGYEGSCTAWAMGYYTKTFQEAKEHDWNLTEAQWLGGYPTPEYQDRIMSPEFVYHLVNGGVDKGSSFPGAIGLICGIGASSWEKMPYDDIDYTSWPSEEAWREAPLYRGNSSGYEILELNTDEDLLSLKNWIASDHLAQIAVAGDYLSRSVLDSNDVWTLDNYDPSLSQLNHAGTVVGYDDTIEYSEGGETRQGAFKIANSWGRGGWEWLGDGCYWISYEAMKNRVGSLYPCFIYRDRIGYDPTLVASFNLDHSSRGECDILIGMGNTSAPLASKSFSNWTNGGEQPFCPNDIILDITEFQDGPSTVINNPFFIQVYDQAQFPPHSGTHYWYSDGVPWSWFRLTQTFAIPETGATLNFWTYYEIEEDWDYGYVEVHDLDTGQWSTLPGLNTTSTPPPAVQNNPNCEPFQFEPWYYDLMGKWNALTGFSGPMYEEEMNLTAFAGHTIELYFTYWTDQYTLELGWFVDDIAIPELGFFDDVESGPTDWTYNGWSIATPPPSANGTVLAFSIEHYDSYSAESMKANLTSSDVPLDTVNLEYVFAFTIAGDIDGDHDVDNDDLIALDQAYGSRVGQPTYEARADFDYDDDIDVKDLIILTRNYGKIILD
jgi:hypothetical protein